MSKYRLEVRSAANLDSAEPMIRIEADWQNTINLFASLCNMYRWQGNMPFPHESEIPGDLEPYVVAIGTSAQFENKWVGEVRIIRVERFGHNWSAPGEFGNKKLEGNDFNMVAAFREQLKKLEGDPFA